MYTSKVLVIIAIFIGSALLLSSNLAFGAEQRSAEQPDRPEKQSHAVLIIDKIATATPISVDVQNEYSWLTAATPLISLLAILVTICIASIKMQKTARLNTLNRLVSHPDISKDLIDIIQSLRKAESVI